MNLNSRMNGSVPFLTLACCFVATATAPGQSKDTPTGTLEGRLKPLIAAHQGKVAVAVKHLRTGESFRHHADDVMPTASLIKVAVMIEAFKQREAGKTKFDSTIVLKDSDKVPGSGLLTTHFSQGTTFPMKDGLHLMMSVSDNTATNLLLDKLGIKNCCDTMKELGFPETRINAKSFRGSTTSVDPARTKKYGLGSTTANEMVGIFEKLHNGEVVSVKASEEMIAMMRKNDDKYQFRRYLPGVDLVYKDGAVNEARTAAGIMYTRFGPVALCVLSNENSDKRWLVDNAGNKLAAEIAREVHRYFCP